MNGRINGSGVLMTPPPEYARIDRIWEKPTTHVVVDKKGDRYKTAKQKKQDDEELGDLGDTTADGFSLPGTSPSFHYPHSRFTPYHYTPIILSLADGFI